ncbi:MAG: Rieske (2Fe-2S) protein [Sulfolobales archaeon]
MPWRRVFRARTLEDSGGVSVKVDDKVIFIARVDGELYGLDGVCPHARCVLGRLDPEKKSVRCLCHGAVFDLATGSMLEPPKVAPDFPRMGLKKYNVRVNEEWVEVEV